MFESNQVGSNRPSSERRLLDTFDAANGSAGCSGGAMICTDDGQPLYGTAGEFGLAFERALIDTIDRSIPVNDSSSKEKAAPTISDNVPSGVLSGDHDAAGADQRQ